MAQRQNQAVRHRMQTIYIVEFFIFPIFLDGCCVGNQQKKRTGLQQDITDQHYRAVEGEIFMMPCSKHMNQHMEVVWSRTGGHREGNERPAFDCATKIWAETKHSGKYTCLTCGSKYSFHLQVVEKSSVKCLRPGESSVNLVVDEGGKVDCPGLTCSDNTDVIWYKGNNVMSEQPRASCEKDGQLHLCRVYKEDTEVYFCDRQVIEQGVSWTFRRAVNVTVVPNITSYSPRISGGNRTEEVELGKPYTLVCKVYFPYELKFSREVRWEMNYGGDMTNVSPLPMEKEQQERVKLEEFKITRSAVIEKVKTQHLNNTYTCFASNPFGNSSVIIKLKEKIKVKWPSLVGYPVVSLLMVAGLGIILHVKWLEVQLIYRSRFQHGKHYGDGKEFDVLLSHVWSPEVDGILMFPLRSRSDTDNEANVSSKLKSDEGEANQRPLQELLPKVLEHTWGYRLCLLERDVLPGGAYTNDVVLAIQKSRMMICLLSTDYLSNSNAVFVLESGVQALLQPSIDKLLLIWTDRDTASFFQPEPPLPTLVQRALKVLPSLDWTSGKPARVTTNFWKSLRKAMPNHRVKLASDQ